jgi:hypothetical protein
MAHSSGIKIFRPPDSAVYRTFTRMGDFVDSLAAPFRVFIDGTEVGVGREGPRPRNEGKRAARGGRGGGAVRGRRQC